MERKNQMTRKQKLVQKYITRLKKFPASNYGVIINIGLYLINQQVLHVVVGYVKENDTIDESLKRKLDLK